MPFRCVAIITPVDKTEPPPAYVIPSVVKRSRGIHASSKFYLALVLFCHVVDSSPPLAAGMTYGGTFSGIVGNSSVLSGAERHIGRSLRFRWWVGVFNRGILKTGVYEVALVRIRLLFLECFRLYRCLISLGYAEPASPEGKLLYRALGWWWGIVAFFMQKRDTLWFWEGVPVICSEVIL